MNGVGVGHGGLVGLGHGFVSEKKDDAGRKELISSWATLTSPEDCLQVSELHALEVEQWVLARVLSDDGLKEG